MVRLVLLVAAILLAVGPGCSGGGGKGDALVGDAEKDERTEPDPGSGDIPGRVDLPRPADLDIAADLGAETDAGTGQELVVPPELGEETGQSPEGLSPEMLALLCDELVCGNFQECFGTEAPAG
ncbi:MAG: hypothetical protein FJ109_20330, partial [Deltaproteobacteria bacterium]|nr:hypothetical protein [Deltaproteobacteria bacterium]